MDYTAKRLDLEATARELFTVVSDLVAILWFR